VTDNLHDGVPIIDIGVVGLSRPQNDIGVVGLSVRSMERIKTTNHNHESQPRITTTTTTEIQTPNRAIIMLHLKNRVRAGDPMVQPPAKRSRPKENCAPTESSPSLVTPHSSTYPTAAKELETIRLAKETLLRECTSLRREKELLEPECEALRGFYESITAVKKELEAKEKELCQFSDRLQKLLLQTEARNNELQALERTLADREKRLATAEKTFQQNEGLFLKNMHKAISRYITDYNSMSQNTTLTKSNTNPVAPIPTTTPGSTNTDKTNS
jgi:hypothetical protein